MRALHAASHALEQLFKILENCIHLSVFLFLPTKISREELQIYIRKILRKRLEKFKHRYGPKNLLVESFAV